MCHTLKRLFLYPNKRYHSWKILLPYPFASHQGGLLFLALKRAVILLKRFLVVSSFLSYPSTNVKSLIFLFVKTHKVHLCFDKNRQQFENFNMGLLLNVAKAQNLSFLSFKKLNLIENNHRLIVFFSFSI